MGTGPACLPRTSQEGFGGAGVGPQAHQPAIEGKTQVLSRVWGRRTTCHSLAHVVPFGPSVISRLVIDKPDRGAATCIYLWLSRVQTLAMSTAYLLLTAPFVRSS